MSVAWTSDWILDDDSPPGGRDLKAFLTDAAVRLQAVGRILTTPELEPYAVMLQNWQEPDDFVEWLATAPLEELVDWPTVRQRWPSAPFYWPERED